MAVGCAFTLVRGRQAPMDGFTASLSSPYRAARSGLRTTTYLYRFLLFLEDAFSLHIKQCILLYALKQQQMVNAYA